MTCVIDVLAHQEDCHDDACLIGKIAIFSFSLHSKILLVHILGVNELVAKCKRWNKHRVIPHRSMCSARRCNVLYLYWPFSYQRVCAAEAAHLQERFSWPETFALGNFHTLKCMEFVNWHGMLYTTLQSCGKLFAVGIVSCSKGTERCRVKCCGVLQPVQSDLEKYFCYSSALNHGY